MKLPQDNPPLAVILNNNSNTSVCLHTYGTHHKLVTKIHRNEHNELSWTFTTARYCQEIWDTNKEEQLDWCKKRLEENEMFDNRVFTDESTIQLKCHQKMISQNKDAQKAEVQAQAPA